MNRVSSSEINLFPINESNHSQLLEIKKGGISYCVTSFERGVADEAVFDKIGYFAQRQDEVVGYFTLRPEGNFAHLDECCLLSTFGDQETIKALFAKIKAIGQANRYAYLLAWTITPFKSVFEQLGGQLSQVVPSEMIDQNRLAYYLTVVDEPWIDLPTAGLVCLKGDQVLLAYSKNKKAWYLPGGKIDTGENSQEALIREIEEELSLSLQPDRLSFLTRIVAPAYGEKKNIMMQQDCYLYDIKQDKIEVANEIGGVEYFSLAEYIQHQIPVPGVLKVFEFLTTKWK